MTRRRIKHERITNETKRNAVFSKRADGLLKKADQLCILCGVDIAVIIHRNGGDTNAVLWPSPEACRDKLRKYLDFPALKRAKKLVTHQRFLEQTVASETENLRKAETAADAREMRQRLAAVAGVGEGLDGLDLRRLKALGSLAEEMLRKLRERAAELAAGKGEAPPPLAGGGCPSENYRETMGDSARSGFSSSGAPSLMWKGKWIGTGAPPPGSGGGGFFRWL